MEMRFLQRAVGPRSAAQRFGFTFDGLFPQTIIYKGRNRDTTWFSMSDKDWPQIEKVYETSLSPDNFEVDGKRRKNCPRSLNDSDRPRNPLARRSEILKSRMKRKTHPVVDKPKFPSIFLISSLCGRRARFDL